MTSRSVCDHQLLLLLFIVLSRRQQEGQYCNVVEKSAHVPSSALFCRTQIFYLFGIKSLARAHTHTADATVCNQTVLIYYNYYVRLYIIKLYLNLFARIRLRLKIQTFQN